MIGWAAGSRRVRGRQRERERPGLRAAGSPGDAIKQRTLDRNVHGGGDLDQRVDAGRTGTGLKQADLGPVERGEPAKLFLAETSSPTCLSEIRREQTGNIGGHQSTSNRAK